MAIPFKMTPKQKEFINILRKKGNTGAANKIEAGINKKDAALPSYGNRPLKGGDKKTLSQVKRGEYTDIRDYTPEELIAEVKRTGKSSAQIKSEVKSYRERTSTTRKEAKGVTPNSGTQMGEILGAGPEEQDKLKKVTEMQNKGGGGKSPAKMTNNKKGLAPNKKMKDRIKRAQIGIGASKPVLKKKY